MPQEQSYATIGAATSQLHEVGSPMSEQSDARAVPVNVMMRRPTLVGVPAMPILAAPLVVRQAHVREAGALAALLGRAFPAEEGWDAAGTERDLGGAVITLEGQRHVVASHGRESGIGNRE